jgi:hypothetical protein
MRAAVALLFVAAAAAAPVPKSIKAKLNDYYPLAEGATWEYSMGGTDVTVRVKDVTDKDGARSAKLVTEHAGKEVAHETIRVDKEGVFRTHINDAEIKPPMPLIKYGLTEDDSWEIKTAVQSSEVKGKLTLKGTEKVKVPAGEYEAVLVVGDCVIAGTTTGTKWWLADGVGIVKMEYSIGGAASTPLELKKYTPGKADKK